MFDIPKELMNTEYIIEAGEHYSFTEHGFMPHFLDFKMYWRPPARLKYLVTFTDSCRYDIGDAQDQWNKLFGYSLSWNHMKRSARIGWRYNKITDSVDVCLYVHDNWKFIPFPFASVQLNVPTSIELLYRETAVYAAYRGQIYAKYDFERKTYLPSYGLFPYFGGKIRAPHNIHLYLERV